VKLWERVYELRSDAKERIVVPRREVFYAPGKPSPDCLVYGDGAMRYDSDRLRFSLVAPKYRREMGRRHPALQMIGPEPDGPAKYTIDVAPAPNWSPFSSKVVAFQFWGVSDMPPLLSLEYVHDIMRLVQLDPLGRKRHVLLEAPMQRAVWSLSFPNGWSGTVVEAGMELAGNSSRHARSDSLGLVYPTQTKNPTFKWGIYCPAFRESPGAMLNKKPEVHVFRVEREELE
jgi:hypothetical protein